MGPRPHHGRLRPFRPHRHRGDPHGQGQPRSAAVPQARVPHVGEVDQEIGPRRGSADVGRCGRSAATPGRTGPPTDGRCLAKPGRSGGDLGVPPGHRAVPTVGFGDQLVQGLTSAPARTSTSGTRSQQARTPTCTVSRYENTVTFTPTPSMIGPSGWSDSIRPRPGRPGSGPGTLETTRLNGGRTWSKSRRFVTSRDRRVATAGKAASAHEAKTGIDVGFCSLAARTPSRMCRRRAAGSATPVASDTSIPTPGSQGPLLGLRAHRHGTRATSDVSGSSAARRRAPGVPPRSRPGPRRWPWRRRRRHPLTSVSEGRRRRPAGGARWPG